MILYIAGPMTGLPDNNYPAFNAIAAALRAKGHAVLNPAENPPPPPDYEGYAWEYYMRLGLAQLVQCDVCVLLFDWHRSRGALIEERIARELGMIILTRRQALDMPDAPKPDKSPMGKFHDSLHGNTFFPFC